MLKLTINQFKLTLVLSLFPLPLLITTAYSNTRAMLNASADMRMQIMSALSIEILYVSFICIVIAIFLAIFVSRSVSNPLKNLEGAMQEINQDNLTVRMEIVSNDELGAVSDGFNDMAKRLEATEQIKESFGKYVSKEIRDEILSGNITLDGEMKRVTLLFSDLRNFTTLVEKHHPTDVVKVINQYFTEMTSAIKTFRGQVLQYVGDEIEAVFGAPVVYDDHPDMAVEAAKEMCRRLVILNNNLESQGFGPLKHGIGIHTGAVLAGNIGSKDRISYAMVGDTVNLASRIESLTKEYGCGIILSQTTHDLLTGKFETEQLSAVEIKGKKEKVMIYKLATT
ncbi:MAG: HAMP domain-containing protein [Deltaproteobacteria bacterium]|nr:HAMP domain-containing protein [Deltaproteobacteria bacterium]